MIKLKLIALSLSVFSLLAVAPGRRPETPQNQKTPSRAPFALELPDLGSASIISVESQIPTNNLRRLKLTIRQPFADTINYGQIYTAINGEAANTICGNIRSGPDGKIINCDLESKPRFSFQPGKNVVEISATDRSNNSYYASYVLIAGTGSIPIESPGKTQSPAVKFTGRKFAAIIGVSNYRFQDAGLNDLRYADADARAIRDFLLQPEGGGFKASDIVYMENAGATTEAVRAALMRLLGRAAAGDLVLIYIAAHGSPDPYDPRKLYFLMNDTKVADMPNTGFGMFELQEILDHVVRAERVIVFIDACHSAGVAGPKMVTGRQLERVENNVFNLYASKLYRETGRAVLTSSDINEISEEGPHWGAGHGVFTWALLDGLRGAADKNRDRVVTAGEVFNYVSRTVRQETNSRQNPRALSGTNQDFPLAMTK